MSRSSKKADDHPVIPTPADDVGDDGHLGSGMTQMGTESGRLCLDGQAVRAETDLTRLSLPDSSYLCPRGGSLP